MNKLKVWPLFVATPFNACLLFDSYSNQVLHIMNTPGGNYVSWSACFICIICSLFR